MPDRPRVAVVVGAYRRRQFLLGAVRSVLAQSLPRDQYELVVTKSFDDPEIDRELQELRIPFARDEDPRIGSWLLRAVARTSAPYVAFLDDDDEFEPQRLEHALAILEADRSLGFYRNRVSVIDETGQTRPRKEWRDHEVDTFFDDRGPLVFASGTRDGLARLGLEQTRVSFNSSTMVVRRELLEGEFAKVFARTQLPDLALFVLAATSPFGLYLDNARLTRYRYYGGNVTHRVPWLAHASEGFADLAEVSRRAGNTSFAEWLAQESRHYGRLFRSGTIVERVGAGADRREVAWLAGEYLRFLDRNPRERAFTLDVWAAELYASSYLVVPGLARRVSARRSARRRPN